MLGKHLSKYTPELHILEKFEVDLDTLAIKENKFSIENALKLDREKPPEEDHHEPLKKTDDHHHRRLVDHSSSHRDDPSTPL